MTLEHILADFQLLDDWDDRYRYVIELGRALPPLPEAARTEANRVRGCASQVWLATEVNGATDGAVPRLIFKGAVTPISCGASSPSSLRYTRAGARMKSF
jgi:cysteine desulfuration protein SufE